MLNLAPYRAETLKIKANPLALMLIACSFALPFLIWAVNQYGPDGLSLSSEVAPWQLVGHSIIALLLPYLLTLEAALGTEKWLRTTPTPAGTRLLSKWVVVLLLVGLGVGLAQVLVPAALTWHGLAAFGSSLLVMTAVALLTHNYAATLIIGVVWLQLGPTLVAPHSV